MSSKNIKNRFDYDPEGLWSCTWQDKYGSGGDLEYCLEMVASYVDADENDIDEVRNQLLKHGKACGSWWSIWHESNPEEEETDEIEDNSNQESLCFFYEDKDQ